jgi:hypothetical protein
MVKPFALPTSTVTGDEGTASRSDSLLHQGTKFLCLWVLRSQRHSGCNMASCVQGIEKRPDTANSPALLLRDIGIKTVLRR